MEEAAEGEELADSCLEVNKSLPMVLMAAVAAGGCFSADLVPNENQSKVT